MKGLVAEVSCSELKLGGSANSSFFMYCAQIAARES